eukprot:gb/GFBE01030151.1/.p1 GENE.gb/GFBE01030151.1/~~gb/GFBE01030151.1/.p1  ORF type:complete len:234 (+),score=69.42 gb/GFBE01030151.1/:1-702(+)
MAVTRGVPSPLRPQRRTLLGLLVLAICLAAPVGLLGARAFVSAPRSHVQTGRAPALQGVRSRLVAQATSTKAEETETKEDDGYKQFIDRWSTKGGILLASTLALVLGFGMEKFFELFTDSAKAGVIVTTVYSLGLFVWTSQYLWRVENKQTTYAQQLTNYEQEVMIRRLSELSEEEIQALCEEVGIDSKELEEVVGTDGAIKELSKKDQVLKLFKNNTMKPQLDPRAGLPGFS